MSNTYLEKPAQSLQKLSRSRITSMVQFGLLASLVFLTACKKPESKTDDVRPVRVVTAALESAEFQTEFPGEIKARIESRLGFRVPGKIIARKVDVGATVKKGQVLMQLDPQDLLLGQAQAKAALMAAESNRDLAKAEFKRYQELREKNFVAQAVLDAKETTYKAAQASFEQAKAGLSNQSNQASYSSLVSDVDGVVTGIEAEIGQVVAAGTSVVRVAKLGEMEIVVGIPEDRINAVKQVKDLSVRLWANKNEVIPAKLRELSPIADPVTRTFTAKLALPSSVKDVKLGMTATASFGMKNPNAMIKLPLTALFQDKAASSVWVVENCAVRLAPVQVASTAGEDVLVATGLTPGQMVVTAGSNLLKSGQKVTILGSDLCAKASAAASASAGVAK